MVILHLVKRRCEVNVELFLSLSTTPITCILCLSQMILFVKEVVNTPGDIKMQSTTVLSGSSVYLLPLRYCTNELISRWGFNRCKDIREIHITFQVTGTCTITEPSQCSISLPHFIDHKLIIKHVKILIFTYWRFSTK